MAVTPEQTPVPSLPTAPPKTTDRGSFEGETVQAKAIPPDTLAEIIRDAIEVRIEHDIYEAVLAQEQAVRGMTRGEIIKLIRRLGD